MRNASYTSLRDQFAVLLPVLIGIAAAGPLVWYGFGQQQTDFGDLALGQQTKSMLASRGEDRVNVARGTECDLCLAGYRKRGGRPGVLWLGNSQLHGINQYTDGQQSCPGLLYDLLNDHGLDTLSVSLPNASPEEQRIVFEYMKSRMDLRLVIVGVCFDDLRSADIREDVAFLSERLESRSDDGGSQILARANRDAEQRVADGEMPAAELTTGPTSRTTQEITEAWLEDFLSMHSALWHARTEARGQILLRLHLLRNTMLGITAHTKRKMLRPAYMRNLQALRTILTESRATDIDVLVYVVPLRNDVPPPYRTDEYEPFKAELRHLVESNGGHFADLEPIVPAAEWGKKDSTVINGEAEIDFMHFQAAGHARLAKHLHEIIARDKLGAVGT